MPLPRRAQAAQERRMRAVLQGLVLAQTPGNLYAVATANGWSYTPSTAAGIGAPASQARSIPSCGV